MLCYASGGVQGIFKSTTLALYFFLCIPWQFGDCTRRVTESTGGVGAWGGSASSHFRWPEMCKKKVDRNENARMSFWRVSLAFGINLAKMLLLCSPFLVHANLSPLLDPPPLASTPQHTTGLEQLGVCVI